MEILVDVILPLAFSGQTFTYSCGEAVSVGMRVVVPLGRKSIIGVVAKVHNDAPNYKIRSVEAVFDQKPAMSVRQIELLTWISDYYMCPLGEVYRRIIPKGIRSANYTAPTRIGYRLINRDLEAIAELLKKRKAALKALEALLFFGEKACVSQKDMLENGATIAGINGLLKFDIVEKMEVPIVIYKDRKGGQLAIKESRKPILYVGRWIEDSLEVVSGAIERAIESGGMCLVLCPNNFYAQRVAELLDDEAVIEHHAKKSENVRSANYLRILHSQNSVKAVVSSSLGLLLPYANLSEIVILDESCYSYKSDRSPRLHGRDCAMMLANLHGANVTLTSVVPSLESYANAKYNRMEMVDLRSESATVKILEKGKCQLFSKYMLNRIEETIANGEQVIVYQNRRGFAGSIVCSRCGYTPICPHCNVTLTLHQTTNSLMCHHCDFVTPAVRSCSGCGSTEMEAQGMGTERVEEQLTHLFPQAKIARVDSDSVARSDAFGEVKDDIESVNCDIIVATQLILSGLKIPKAALCVVVNADNMFLSTDFRTSERTISTLTQLRNLVSNELIIQAANSQNPLLKVLEGDYFDFFDEELTQRGQHNYPPITRLVTIRLTDENPRLLQSAALELEAALLPTFGNRLMSPYEPLGDRRLNGKFVLELMLRLKRDANLGQSKRIANGVITAFLKRHSTISVIIDVDPL